MHNYAPKVARVIKTWSELFLMSDFTLLGFERVATKVPPEPKRGGGCEKKHQQSARAVSVSSIGSWLQQQNQVNIVLCQRLSVNLL
jgi:hypothetical protein